MKVFSKIFLFLTLILIGSQLSTGQSSWALGNLSVSCLREKPSHSAELGSQVLMGMPVKILGKEGEWLFVETIDGYKGYIIHHSLHRLSESEFSKWKKSSRGIYTSMLEGKVYADTLQFDIVSDIVPGSIIQIKNTGKRFAQVHLPDGREGYVPSADITDLKEWAAQPYIPNAVEIYGKQSIGSPYLWGGNSVKGMDCSGLTYTALWLAGRVVPRNASAQAKIGMRINEPSKLKAGDLVFFSSPSGRINHVGCYIGNNKYIESSGRVKVTERHPSLTKGYSHGCRIEEIPAIIDDQNACFFLF